MSAQKNESGTQRVIGLLLSALVAVYAITTCLVGVYFNWQFARANGFLKWLLFGEIAATLKSLIWPYYAFFPSTANGSESWTVAVGVMTMIASWFAAILVVCFIVGSLGALRDWQGAEREMAARG